MKATLFLILPTLLLAVDQTRAQTATEPAAVPPAAVPPAAVPPAAVPPAATSGAAPAATEPTPGMAVPGAGPQKSQLEASEEGYLIKDAPLNDIFQFLAKAAGKQYFHNAKIAGTDFRVTGHLNDGNPLQQMEELAFMYGLNLHTKGNTIYALTQAQLAQLPSIEYHYQLKYLRPTDIKQIQELIKPMLSPATGIVNFEPKTNTIILIDSALRIEQARALLHGIDRAKGQIIVETKILRINSTVAEHTGVNWSASLGKDSTTKLSITRDLNSVFGLPPSPASSIPEGAGTNLVLSPVQVAGVLRALSEGGLASQVSNPTLITEDNEMATISVIDRIPIITSTSTATTGAANPTVTEEVRYKIDASDKSIDSDPDKHREIGISLVVTPTLLPDGTVRMKLRPRSAQIVEQIQSSSTKNFYPRVTESMIETLARVPNGFSLVVGGFYGEAITNGRTKVPLLGDIPVINFFFKSREASKEKTSLVFIVTPKSYDPTNRSANANASNFVRRSNSIGHDYNWADDKNPGPSDEPNLHRTLRGMKPQPAPYYPLPGEEPAATPASEPSPQPSAKPRLTKARRE
ncbi:MAG: secretin N-terminal domain-containing protein [Verrucomicrobiota bacterium]